MLNRSPTTLPSQFTSPNVRQKQLRPTRGRSHYITHPRVMEGSGGPAAERQAAETDAGRLRRSRRTAADGRSGGEGRRSGDAGGGGVGDDGRTVTGARSSDGTAPRTRGPNLLMSARETIVNSHTDNRLRLIVGTTTAGDATRVRR